MKSFIQEPEIDRSQFGIRIDSGLQKIMKGIAEKYNVSVFQIIEAMIARTTLPGGVKFKSEVIKDIETLSSFYNVEVKDFHDELGLFEPIVSSNKKGVIFDTNETYDPDSIWEMFEKKRVSAYGGTKYVIDYLSIGDTIFYYKKGTGIVAAAEIINDQIKYESAYDENYKEVKFLTKLPNEGESIDNYLSTGEIRSILGKNFFWSRTLKVPYLNPDETIILLEKLIEKLGSL